MPLASALIHVIPAYWFKPLLMVNKGYEQALSRRTVMAEFELIKTYSEAREVVQDFAREKGLGFCVIVSPPGVGKTNTFYKQICKGALLFQGSLSPFQLYMNLYENLDVPVVFDDVDELFDSRAGVNLIKCLGQTDHKKMIMWEKSSPQLDKAGVPRRFETTSRLMLFANTIKSLEENLKAVLDRAHCYRFEPTAYELHMETKRWFKDKEVWTFVGKHLDLIEQPSMRDYVKAAEKKRLGRDWQSYLMSKWQDDPKLALILKLLRQKFPTPLKRQKAFMDQGGGAEATYKRYLSKANKIIKSAKMNKGGAPEPKAEVESV